ncbi:MAG: segregation/condensation protein A [Bacillota bacterium]|nr:segregation/condensation protein A [Bacillota bacterium]
MGYKVKLNIFEGPFDLLVYLIENAQMSIYDIQISEITDQYLAHIDQMKKMDVEVTTEFMVLAAALIEIKSKMLLPRRSPDDDPTVIDDPRTDLVARLLEYKRFKLLAAMMQEKEEESFHIFEKPQEDLSVYTNEPDEYLSLDLDKFVTAFELFLRRKQKMEEMERHYARIERQRETTEAKIVHIRDMLKDNVLKNSHKDFLYFKELLSPASDKYDVALTFVSMLEMLRQRRIEAEQKYNFGDITVRPTERLDEAQEIATEETLPEALN